jgi:hypothetical protein
MINMAAAVRAILVCECKRRTMTEQKRKTLIFMSIFIVIHLIFAVSSEAQLPPPPPSLNNPPSSPELVVPADNPQPPLSTTVSFGWNKSSDPDGDTLTYDLYVCEDADFMTGCINETGIAFISNNTIYYAGIANSGTELLMMGCIMIFMGISGDRKKIPLLMAIMAIAGILLISCGSGGGGSSGDEISANSATASDDVGITVSGLKNGATYYWKAVAKDGFGGEGHSSVRSFETQ